MKPITQILGISVLAMLGTSPASAILVESFEDSTSFGGTGANWTIQTDGVKASFAVALSTTDVTNGTHSLAVTVPGEWTNGISDIGNATEALGSVSLQGLLTTNPYLYIDITTSSSITDAGQIWFCMQGGGIKDMSWTQNGFPVPAGTSTLAIDLTNFNGSDLSTSIADCTVWYKVFFNFNFAQAGTVYMDNIRAYGSRLWLSSDATGATRIASPYGNVYPLQTGEGWFVSCDNMDWQYGVGTKTGMAVYDPELGWLWTNESTYPYYYDYAQSAWVYYLTSYSTTAKVRWYYIWNLGGKSGWSTAADLAAGKVTQE
jgi:hypothetical protein